MTEANKAGLVISLGFFALTRMSFLPDKVSVAVKISAACSDPAADYVLTIPAGARRESRALPAQQISFPSRMRVKLPANTCRAGPVNIFYGF